MKLQERQYSTDDLTRCLAVMKEVERVRRRGVIHEREGEVAGQRLGQKTVKRFVQTRHLIVTCSRDEQRDVARKIID